MFASVSLSLVLSSLVNALEQLILLAKYQHVLLRVAFCELDTGFSILVHKLWLSEAISVIQLQISHSTTWQFCYC